MKMWWPPPPGRSGGSSVVVADRSSVHSEGGDTGGDGMALDTTLSSKRSTAACTPLTSTKALHRWLRVSALRRQATSNSTVARFPFHLKDRDDVSFCATASLLEPPLIA
jgi:hypothetical protein